MGKRSSETGRRKSTDQLRATLTLSKSSLLATLRSPTSVVFSILFPVVFILVFGSMVGDQTPSMKLALAPGCDTANLIFKALEKIPSITLQRNLSPAEQSDALQKGRLTAILRIVPDGGFLLSRTIVFTWSAPVLPRAPSGC